MWHFNELNLTWNHIVRTELIRSASENIAYKAMGQKRRKYSKSKFRRHGKFTVELIRPSKGHVNSIRYTKWHMFWIRHLYLFRGPSFVFFFGKGGQRNYIVPARRDGGQWVCDSDILFTLTPIWKWNYIDGYLRLGGPRQRLFFKLFYVIIVPSGSEVLNCIKEVGISYINHWNSIHYLIQDNLILLYLGNYDVEDILLQKKGATLLMTTILSHEVATAEIERINNI